MVKFREEILTLRLEKVKDKAGVYAPYRVDLLSADQCAAEISRWFDEEQKSQIQSLSYEAPPLSQLEEAREKLRTKEVKSVSHKLEWDLHVSTDTTFVSSPSGRYYTSPYSVREKQLEATVTCEEDRWNLRIKARNRDDDGYNWETAEDFPEEEWKPNSIREAIVQGFLKLTRDSLG